MTVHHVCVWSLQTPEEDLESHGTGVTDGVSQMGMTAIQLGSSLRAFSVLSRRAIRWSSPLFLKNEGSGGMFQ